MYLLLFILICLFTEYRLTEIGDELSDFEEVDDAASSRGLPQMLREDCDKLKKDPNHHKGYLTLQELLEVSQGNRDHEHAGLIKDIGAEKWRMAADSVVLLRTTKEVRRKVKKKPKRGPRPSETVRKVFNSTGFVVDIEYEVPEGCCTVITANHNILKDDSDTETVESGDIEVVFFHDGLNDSTCVTCNVKEIAPMQSPPIREVRKEHDQRHLDYAVLYVKVDEKVEELITEAGEVVDETQKELLEKQIHSLFDFQRLKPDSSVRLQLMQMSSAKSYVQDLIIACIGHPHGAPKQISFGSMTSDTEKLYHELHPEQKHVAANHTCITCAGSSGSPIFAFLNPIPDRGIPKMTDHSHDVFFLHVQDICAVSIQSIELDVHDTQIAVNKKTTQKVQFLLILRSLMIFTKNSHAIVEILYFFNLCIPRDIWSAIKKSLDAMKEMFNSNTDLFLWTYPEVAVMMKHLYNSNQDPKEEGDNFIIIPISSEYIEVILQDLETNHIKYVQSQFLQHAPKPVKPNVLTRYLRTTINLLKESLLREREFLCETNIMKFMQSDGIAILLKILSSSVYDKSITEEVLTLLHHIVVIGDSDQANKDRILDLGHPTKLCEILISLNSPPTPVFSCLSLSTLLFLYNGYLPKQIQLHFREADRMVQALFDGSLNMLTVADEIMSLHKPFPILIANYLHARDVRILTQALPLYTNDFKAQLIILMILKPVCWRSNKNKEAAFAAGIIPILANLLKDKTYRNLDEDQQHPLLKNRTKLFSKLQLWACILLTMLTPGVLTTQNLQRAEDILKAQLLHPLVCMLDNGERILERHLIRRIILSKENNMWRAIILEEDQRPAIIPIYKDGVILTAIIKLMQAAKKLGTLERAHQVFLDAGGRDKITTILQNGDEVPKVVASGLKKYLI